MLDTYTNTDQTLAVNEPLAFNINRIASGCSIRHSAGSTTVNICKPGKYVILFNCDAAESTTAGDITVQMFKNSVLVPAAEATETSSALTDIVNMDFHTAIKVTPCDVECGNRVSLTFLNTGVAATFSNTELVVYKQEKC